MSLQTGSIVTLEVVAMLIECCPVFCDSSLELLVFFFVSGAVSFFQVDAAFMILYLNGGNIDW